VNELWVEHLLFIGVAVHDLITASGISAYVSVQHRKKHLLFLVAFVLPYNGIEYIHTQTIDTSSSSPS
jgi:hypothetical protein